MSNYIKKQLSNGEYIIYEAHITSVPILIRFCMILIITSILGGIFWNILDNIFYGILIALSGILIATILSIKLILYKIGTEIVLTNTKLHCKSGIITIKDNRETPLRNIDRIDIDKPSFLSVIFNYGDIELQTIGSDGFFKFTKIDNPEYFRKIFTETQDQAINGLSYSGNQTMREIRQQAQKHEQEKIYKQKNKKVHINFDKSNVQ